MEDKQQGHNSEPISLNTFLQQVEKKAYNMALVSLAHQAEALDIVQDAMLKFVSNYQHKPTEQWKPLFYRIVQNQILDWHRKQKVRKIITFWKEDDESPEPWITEMRESPESQVFMGRHNEHVMEVLNGLPVKQQQCFLLRAWEGLSVKETASIMKCSEGSIKTHFSRASAKLKSVLEEDNE